MNIWSITGNLGKDAEVRSAGSTSVASFSVAVKSGYGEKQQTIWVDCSIWGKQAESRLIDYLKKGQQVAVSGELGTREYNGKTYITLRVLSIDLTGKRDDMPIPSKPAQNAATKPQPPASSNLSDIDDAPF